MILDQIPAPTIAAISGYELGDGTLALAFVDVDGNTHGFKVSRDGLTQIFCYIGHILNPQAVDPLWP